MMGGIDKVKTWLREIKEDEVVKAGGVPTEEDLKVPESTAQDHTMLQWFALRSLNSSPHCSEDSKRFT
jgi:hypothetical protein